MSVDAKEIQMTPEMAKAIADATNPADIRLAVQNELAKQAEVANAAAAAEEAAKTEAATKAAEVAAAATGGPFTRTENIGGREFTFEAATEAEADQMVLNAYRVAYAMQPTETAAAVVAEPVPTPAEIEAARANEIAAKAELELKFKRGEISTTDYLEQSGAVADYLAKQGVPLDALRASVEQTQDNTLVKSWADATTEFLNGPAGSDWPGGGKNLEFIGLKLAQLGLTEAPDKVQALAQAWQEMKRNGTIFPGDTPAATAPPAAAATTAPPAAAAATTAAPPAAAAATAPPAAPKTAATSSSVFGASSGVGQGEGVSAPAPKGDVKIDPNASPAEILEAWKAQNLAAGKNPNQAFHETFGAKHA